MYLNMIKTTNLGQFKTTLCTKIRNYYNKVGLAQVKTTDNIFFIFYLGFRLLKFGGVMVLVIMIELHILKANFRILILKLVNNFV